MRIEVTCINKSDRYSVHERIRSIGGGVGSDRWKHTQERAISFIESETFTYFVNQGGHEVDVVVATSAHGHKYLKTTADGEQSDSLLSLPECP
jgi:hypothetical protein